MSDVVKSHPVIRFLVFVDDDVNDEVVERLRAVVAELADARAWLLGQPELVENDEDGVRDAAVLLHVHSAFDDDGRLLDDATDRQHLQEVWTVLEALRPVSHDLGLELGVELDDVSVGWIDGGELTDGLQEGFLDPWAARFA